VITVLLFGIGDVVTLAFASKLDGIGDVVTLAFASKLDKLQ
jgi:hypothetical protein